MSIVMQINPFEFFSDKNGDALDSGYVWVGEANKYSPAFPITAYYDKDLTIPAAMPLRTSNGYIVRNGAPAFLYINGNYSILVQNKFKAQVYYVPDFLLIGSGSAVSTGDLANTTDPTKGAWMTGYARSPLVNTITTVHQMLDAETVNLYEFAALITVKPAPNDPNTWDWTPALQAALLSYRKKLVVQAGIYQISSSCAISSGRTIEIESGAVIQRRPGTTPFNMLVPAGSSNNITICGEGAIDGNRLADALSPTNPAQRFSGVHMVGVTNSVIRGVSVIGTVNNEVNGGIFLDGCSDILIEETTATGNDRTGIVVLNSTRCKIVRNLTHTNVGSGITSSNNVDCEYIGNVVYNNGMGSGTNYTGLNASGTRSRVIGNVSYGNTASGINVGETAHTSNESVLANNVCYSNGLDGISIQNSTRVICTGNVTNLNTRTGIRLFSGSTGCDINDNCVTGNFAIGIYVSEAGHSIKGNRTQRNDGAGIYLETTTSLCMVLDNISHGNGVVSGANAVGILVQGDNHTINDNRSNDDGTGVQLYGLWLAGAQSCNVVGNNFGGNVTAAIRESLTPTYSTRGNRCGTNLLQGVFTATAGNVNSIVPNNNSRDRTRINVVPFNAAAALRPGFVSAVVLGTSFTVTFATVSAGTEIYAYEID